MKMKTPMDEQNVQQEAPEAPEAPEAAETDAPAQEEAPACDAEQLESELAKAQSLAEEYLNLAQRVQADFDNFRRRNESVRADSYAEGQRQVATAMLAVLDNLERALAAAPEEGALRTGVEMTLKQMLAVYEKLGVTAIDRTGEKFDPNLENAIMQGTPEEGEPGTVCMVLQKGYRMGSFVLRHAMVKVVPDA